jgi:hypothetical protein
MISPLAATPTDLMSDRRICTARPLHALRRARLG